MRGEKPVRARLTVFAAGMLGVGGCHLLLDTPGFVDQCPEIEQGETCPPEGATGTGGSPGSAAAGSGGECTPKPESCASPEDENCDGYDCGQWAQIFGDASASLVGVDAAGNTYVAGDFVGSIVFPGTTLNEVDGGDAFLIKFDAAGRFVWGNRFGGAGPDWIHALIVDATGDVIIGGRSATAINFGGSSVPKGLFIARFNGAGQHIWSVGWGGLEEGGPADVSALALTPGGDIIAAGECSGIVNFGDGNVATKGVNDAFVARLRGTDGSSKIADGGWGKTFGDPGSQYATGVAVDPAGNIFLAITFDGSFEIGATTVTSKGGYDILLAKLDAGGNLLKLRRVGDDADQRTARVRADSVGGVILTGTIDGTVWFGGDVVVVPPGSPQPYAVKYTASLDYQWLKPPEDPYASSSVAVDDAGNTFLFGGFKGSHDVSGVPLTAQGDGYDLFVAKLRPNGDLAWVRQFGDAADQYAGAIAVTSTGEPVIVGATAGTIDFGTGPLTAVGQTGAFVAKLGN